MASYKTYTVVRGDTLSHIALRFGTTVSYLARLNNIKNVNLIYVGQVLKISEIVTVTPAKPNPTPAPAPKPSAPSTPSTPSTPSKPTTPVSNTTHLSTSATITAFGLQADTDRTFFATWSWDRSETANFEVIWYYGTNNNVKFIGTKTTVNADEPQSIYNAPENATYVSFKVKPISKTRKINDSDVLYWTAQWSSEKTYNMSNLPPDELPTPTVTLEDYTLKIEVNNIPDEVDTVEFDVIQNDSKIYQSVSSRVTWNVAKYSMDISPGNNYKVRCRAVKKGIRSGWSAFSNNINTKPSTPMKIQEIRAVSTTALTLIWDEVVTADSYEIEHAVDKDYLGASNASTTISNITGNRYTITGLTTGEKYFIRVRAVNAQGKSDWGEIASIILGDKPAAPTTWSSTSTVIVGEELKLYWMHNSKDGSKEVKAELKYTLNNQDEVITEVLKTNISDDVSYYYFRTSSYTEGSVLRWSVRTAGITNEYGEWSATRMINMYAPPSLSLVLSDDAEGSSSIREVTKYPFYILANSGPNSQKPIGYHVSVVSKSSYEAMDEFGNIKMVVEGQEIFSKFYDVDVRTLSVCMTPGDINLENNCRYEIICVTTMDSGLTKEQRVEFTTSLIDTEYYPTAEIIFNEENLSVNIRPYCTYRPYIFYEVKFNADNFTYTRTKNMIPPLEGTSVDNAVSDKDDLIFVGVNSISGDLIYFSVVESKIEYLVENVKLSVYRQTYDGRFIAIATNIDNLESIYVTDPHPSLDAARYRIVATDMINGTMSYTDMPAYALGIKSVIIQWDETWSDLMVIDGNVTDDVTWAGSMLKLPYNIDVSDNNTIDVSLINYVGRSHPVSYYGTHLGVSATWNTDIPKSDKNTLYGLRRLAIYTGDVYVREPSGSGYWANVSVSFSQKHREMVIPVTLEIKRVEGGM